MSDFSSLYWIARCDGCGKPITAHAMSVLREAMLCLECLNTESQAIAEQRNAGQIMMFASEISGEYRAPDSITLDPQSKGLPPQLAGRR